MVEGKFTGRRRQNTNSVRAALREGPFNGASVETPGSSNGEITYVSGFDESQANAIAEDLKTRIRGIAEIKVITQVQLAIHWM